MDREEAIDILNDERIVIWTEPDEEEIARKQNEAIDMAIEALSADRPTELLDDGTLKVNVKSGAEVNRVLVWGDDGSGGLYYAEHELSGKWIIDEYGAHRCPYCNAINNTEYKRYCPNCGAKMKGEK